MQETITQTKVCTKCSIEKDISMFSKDKYSKDGFQYVCKQCGIIYRKANKERLNAQKREYYQLNKDKITLRISKYRIENKDHLNKQSRKYKQINKIEISIKNKEYRDANKDRLNLQKRKYYAQNSDKKAKYHEINKNENNRKMREYFKTEKGKASRNNSEHKRRTKTKSGDVTTQQLLELRKNAKNCYWCNESLKEKSVHLDHYIPLAKGGEHTISNLVISCSKCNNIKKAKDPILFANSIGKLL